MGYRNMGVEICGVGYGVVWDMGVWGTVVAVGTEVVTALGVSPSHCGVTHGGFRPILSCSNKRGAFLGGGGGWTLGVGRGRSYEAGLGGRSASPAAPRMRRTHPQSRTAAGTPPGPPLPYSNPIATP